MYGSSYRARACLALIVMPYPHVLACTLLVLPCPYPQARQTGLEAVAFSGTAEHQRGKEKGISTRARPALHQARRRPRAGSSAEADPVTTLAKFRPMLSCEKGQG